MTATDTGPRVSLADHLFAGLIHNHPGLWLRLGNMESDILSERLADIAIDRPVYIAGLARAGTTVLLEILNTAPGAVTHRYREFPPVFTPYAWNWLQRWLPRKPARPVERAHKDRILITPESPEAMEEPIWAAFFPHLHQAGRSEHLGAGTSNPRFESFYRDHIRKLLLARGGRRYLSKSNYNITRLEYLLRLFPDARFIVPIRDPVDHVASLMKQQRLFQRVCAVDPRARAHLRQVGHFEFGPDRMPIHTGDDEGVRAVQRAWTSAADEVEGWARYWALVYGYLAERLQRSETLAKAVRLLSYEDFCRGPDALLRQLLRHADLTLSDPEIASWCARVGPPDYYQSGLTASDREKIRSLTGDVVAKLGLLDSQLDP